MVFAMGARLGDRPIVLGIAIGLLGERILALEPAHDDLVRLALMLALLSDERSLLEVVGIPNAASVKVRHRHDPTPLAWHNDALAATVSGRVADVRLRYKRPLEAFGLKCLAGA